MEISDQIKQYASKTPELIGLYQGQQHLLEIYAGALIAAQGQLISIPDTGEQVRLLKPLGQRKWIAQRLHTTFAVPKGGSLQANASQAAFPAPQGNTLSLHGPGFAPEDAPHALPYTIQTPEFKELSGTRTPVHTGVQAIDLLSPLAVGGVNLIIDSSPTKQGKNALLEATKRHVREVAGQNTYRELIITQDTTYTPTPDQLAVLCANAERPHYYLAMRALFSWNARLRTQTEDKQHHVVTVDLPLPSAHEALLEKYSTPKTEEPQTPQQTLSEILSYIGDHLTSTHHTTITTVISLQLESFEGDLSQILDTLSLGDLDSLIVIDREGHYMPQQSRSKCELSQELAIKAQATRGLLHQAEQLLEKSTIFGDDELTDKELSMLEEAPLWSPSLK